MKMSQEAQVKLLDKFHVEKIVYVEEETHEHIRKQQGNFNFKQNNLHFADHVCRTTNSNSIA